MDHSCLVCGVELVKIPGPGRWPKRCIAHRGTKTVPMSPEEKSASAYRAAKKRWETWQRPEMKALASERAKAAAAALWAGHVTVARQCGHPADKLPSGAAVSWCDECTGSPVACQWEGCSAVIGTVGERGRKRKWCTDHYAEKRRLEPKDNPALECSEPDCERPVRARNVCSMHWKRLRASEVGHAKQPFDGARMRRHYERRTWQRSGENVTIVGLRERDGDNCGICGLVIDFVLSGREPMGRTVDHVLPRSKGGAHSWANTQLAHLRCNLSKGAKLPGSIAA